MHKKNDLEVISDQTALNYTLGSSDPLVQVTFQRFQQMQRSAYKGALRLIIKYILKKGRCFLETAIRIYWYAMHKQKNQKEIKNYSIDFAFFSNFK